MQIMAVPRTRVLGCLSIVLGAVAVFFVGGATTRAAESGVGVYPLGFRGPMAGFVPPPGWYFQNDLLLYKGDASASRPIPFNGQLAADVRVKMLVDVPTLLWSTPYQIMGGNLAFSASLPMGGPRVDAGLTLTSPVLPPVARNVRDSTKTIGDPFVVAAVGWHSGNFHWMTGVGVNVPVGDYREGALANVAFHRWAADLHGAVTYLNMATGLDLSGAAGITFNGTNPATDYKTGTEFHLELSATQNLPSGFSFGVVSYYYNQLTGDSGTGARLGPFKGRVAAIGGSLGYAFKIDGRDISTRVRVYREFDVQNRLEGTTAFLTLAMPLHVQPTPARPGLMVK